MPMTFARRARTRDAGEFSRDDSGRLRLTRHARFHLEAKPQVSRLCEAAKAPDDFFNAAEARLCCTAEDPPVGRLPPQAGGRSQRDDVPRGNHWRDDLSSKRRKKPLTS